MPKQFLALEVLKKMLGNLCWYMHVMHETWEELYSPKQVGTGEGRALQQENEAAARKAAAAATKAARL